ncbi:MAG: hypothetical protein V1686_00470, partial [Patescibacteria group bacterium]
MAKKDVSVLMSAVGVIAGFVEKLVAKFKVLGGTVEQLYELFVGKRSEEFLSKVADLAMSMVAKAKPAFPIFKTVTLGVHKSVEAYRKALSEAGFRIGDWASDILNKIKVSQNQVQLDLVKVTVKDLGFVEATSLKQIYAKAKKLGLNLCPNEVGPALRLAYPDQPNGERIRIAMEPISDSDG